MMKKTISVMAIALLCLASAFAGLKIGATMTTKIDTDQDLAGSVYSLDVSERDYWADSPEQGRFGFTLASDFTLSVTFGNFHVSQPIHADIGMSILPGISYSVNSRMCVSALAGVRYTRLGYHGDVEAADGWDRLLNIATLGILGANPVRKIDTLVDLGVKFKGMGFGVQFAYPVWQKGVTDYKDGFTASFYTVFNF